MATATIRRNSLTYKADVQPMSGERTVVGTITTSAIDRTNEVVDPRGLDLRAYKTNPVVLWQHDSYTAPIGRCLWIKPTADSRGLVAKVEFAKTDFAGDVMQMYRDGILSAFSIGFRSIEASAPTPEEIRRDPDLSRCRLIHRRSELLEFSCVVIPCNPDAVVGERMFKSLEANKVYATLKAADPDNDGDDDSTPEGDTDNDQGQGDSKPAPTIKAGHYVEWGKGRSGGCGKVKSVHRVGKVPGVENACECSDEAPACRIRCYKQADDGKWKATPRHMGVPLAEVTRIEHEMDFAQEEDEEAAKEAPPPVLPVVPRLPATARTLEEAQCDLVRRLLAGIDLRTLSATAARHAYDRAAGAV